MTCAIQTGVERRTAASSGTWDGTKNAGNGSPAAPPSQSIVPPCAPRRCIECAAWTNLQQ